MPNVFTPPRIIGLFIRTGKTEIVESALYLADYLHNAGYTVSLDAETIGLELLAQQGHSRHAVLPRITLLAHIDVAIVLGGDGTMLAVGRAVAPFKIPLIGINQGRLGFMTDIAQDKSMCAEILAILQGKTLVEERLLLQATVNRAGVTVCESLAVNDIVLNRGALGSMIEFEVFIDNQFVYSQRSDGLIINTPTGSTAYALAAGGPILHPALHAITLVPICPQALNNRPIAVRDSSQVRCLLTRGADARVHFDGQSHLDLLERDEVLIERHPDSLTIWHPQNYNYYDVLRQKLHWGERLI